MMVWHGTEDTRRDPRDVFASESVSINVGTFPASEKGQKVSVVVEIRGADGNVSTRVVRATWLFNKKDNVYWSAELGTFKSGDRVEYVILADSVLGDCQSHCSSTFEVRSAPSTATREIHAPSMRSAAQQA
jgi:hypothetical protein